jgi:hypothetical protein
VKAEATGFKAAETKQVAVAANQPSTVQLKLEPGAAAETVEVSAASPAGLQAQALDSASLNSVQSARQENMQQESAEVSRKKQRLSKAAAVAGTGPAIALSQWSLSPAGAVQRSSDGGKTWNPVPVVGGQTFRALSAVGTNIWVGGNNAALYHSADSGQHWAQVVPVADGHKLEGDIVHVDFDNAVSGTLRTSSGETWTTVDGGQSWRLK